ncbi:MAG: hypothetical protein AAF432_12855 [Planctomycetota bacterium]
MSTTARQRQWRWIGVSTLFVLLLIDAIGVGVITLGDISAVTYETPLFLAVLRTLHLWLGTISVVLIGVSFRRWDQPRDVGIFLVLSGTVLIIVGTIVAWFYDDIAEQSMRVRDWLYGTMLTSGIFVIILAQNIFAGSMACPTPTLRTLQRISVIVFWAFGLTMIVLCWFIHAAIYFLPVNLHGRLFVGLILFAVLAFALTLALPLAHRAMRRRMIRRDDGSQRTWSLSFPCPSCSHLCAWSAGSNRCNACGYGLQINVDEPRCACGYLLFQLTQPVCPECGADVPETALWTPGAE